MRKLLKKLFSLSKDRVGQGWDYIVFKSKNEGRVIKIIQPLYKQLWLRKEMPWRMFFILTKKGSRKEHMLNTAKLLKPILERNGSILANPQFRGTSYTQDYVITLREFLKETNTSEALDIINKLCLLNEKCWELGFSNTNFKFSSYGVTLSKEVALIDLSGLTFSPVKIRKLLQSNKWNLSFDVQLLISNKLNIYYKQKIEQSKNKFLPLYC